MIFHCILLASKKAVLLVVAIFLSQLMGIAVKYEILPDSTIASILESLKIAVNWG